MRNLLKLGPTTELCLVLETDHWLAVADEIRQGRCNVQTLDLCMCQVTGSEATEAVKAIASAIREDHNLDHLTLQMKNGFTDEAGVALAEALAVNTTLSIITLSVILYDRNADNRAALGASAYEAFTTMLRVNANLVLEVPPFDNAVGDQRLIDSRNQMRIEQRLNEVGRGRLLSSSQTAREEWVDALDTLNELNSYNVDESPEFIVSCLYSLLRLYPATCMS
jgi:hypothetical protein